MTKKTKKAIDDPTNISFMDLIEHDNAKVVGSIAVDDGRIELGNCGIVQIKLKTASGDGFYPVWQGKKYVVIEMSMLNIMTLDDELNKFEEENS